MRFSKRRQPADFGQADAAASNDAFAQVVEPAVTLDSANIEPGRVAARALARAEASPPALELEGFEDAPPSAWPIWLTAFLVSALWALAPIAFAVGYRSKVAPLQDDSFALIVFALLAIGPAIFVWGAAYLIRQGQKLGFETRRTKSMAEDMLSPALLAAARTGHIAESIRQEIARAGAAADEARETLVALRNALAAETDGLIGATAQSIRTAGELATTLGRERSEMGALAQTLDAQSAKVADAITQQARMVSQAAEVAETQIREAESVLAARAADISAVAGEASAATRAAGEDLNRHIARLETAGVGVAEQIRAVETGLSDQRTALVTLAGALRADQETFAAEADAHSGRLAEFIEHARRSATEMSEHATGGGEALRQLMAHAAEQFRDLAERAGTEREAFGQSTLQSIGAVAAAAAEERAKLEGQTRAAIAALSAAAEETRAAAASHAATAREQVDQLSEAAFSAGQKANQAFEARLEEARALVDQSSKLAEEAGAATARRLEEGAKAAQAAMDELATMMGEIEARAARLPAAARSQADQVRTAVSHGVEALMEQARRTAEEAQAIDAAFQHRVRRNFEMLSEAVRLMGAVAGAPALIPETRSSAPATPETAAAPSEEPEPLELRDRVEEGGAALAGRLGLRNRLRLTPTATDAEFSAVFGAAGGPPAEAVEAEAVEAEAEDPDDGETWTWKDLLASLDGEDGEGPRLEAALSAELLQMGVEPAKLLPRGRIEEVAAAIQAGDGNGAREVVRKLAPAAIRRIGRRLATDDDVRRRAEVYVRRYKTLMDDAAVRDPEGFLLANLLGGDSGRLYLLLDAAAGE